MTPQNYNRSKNGAVEHNTQYIPQVSKEFENQTTTQ